jgi:hypothetical protein
VNHISSYASNPVSTIKCFSESFTKPRETKGERDRESKFSITEHMRDLGPRHLLINSKLSLPKRPKLFLCIGSIIMRVSVYSTEKHLLRSFVASSPLCDPILVEIKCAYGRRNTLCYDGHMHT